MVSQPGSQRITIRIFPTHEVKATRHWNLVRQKNITREIFFFKNHADNEAERLVPELFLFFKKALFDICTSGTIYVQYMYNIT